MSKGYPSDDDVIHAIEQWLEYGVKAKNRGEHKGYFSQGGWAADTLTAHLRQLKLKAFAKTTKRYE